MNNRTVGEKKSIFEYDDYRALLKELYLQKKAQNKNFSYRSFAKVTGLSYSLLPMAIAGKCDLSENSIEKFAKALRLNSEESRFFLHLVLFNQAKNHDEKQIHAEKILRCRGYRRTHPLVEAQFQYYSRWYLVPIREALNLHGFVEDPEMIANATVPKLKPEQVKSALESLEKLGLLVRNKEGRLEQSDALLATGEDLVSSTIVKWHREMIQRASESLDAVPREKREISALTFSVSQEGVKKMKKLIQAFRQELLEARTQDCDPIESVYQMNFQLFPLIELGKGKK